MNDRSDPAVVLMAGIPQLNAALYRRIRFLVGDPAACLEYTSDAGKRESILILRDIEMDRARRRARVDRVACPADFAPQQGLSGDRETATAQSVAEWCVRRGVKRVVADRSLPLIYSALLQQAGVSVTCDLDLGVLDRRAKDEQELNWLREAQAVTEGAMEMACRLVANARPDAQGQLHHDGAVLTSERVRAAIDHWLLDRQFSNPPAIIAGGPQGADCHTLGSGPLYTEQPVIIDIFPQHKVTRYNGDCTRTVVNGQISDELLRMHSAVVKAKAAAQDAVRAGVTGEDVHKATCRVMRDAGFQMGVGGEGADPDRCAMTHGTGHGIGLEVHEPPLLDFRAPELVVGDVLTIEPGLYCGKIGGVRVEDMVVVLADGYENFNQLPEGLDWK